MAVSIVVINKNENSASTSITSAAFTSATSKKIIAHCVTDNPAIAIPQYNGVNMTLVNEWTNVGTSNPRTAIYIATGLASSASVSFTAAFSGKLGIAIYEVTDFLSVRSSSNSGAVSAAISGSATAQSGDLVIGFQSSWYPFVGYSAGSGVTSLPGLLTGTTHVGFAAGTKPGAPSSVTIDATMSSGQWSQVTLAIAPATVVPAPTNGTVNRSVAGDQITVTCSVTSTETPSANATVTPASGTPIALPMTITGTLPNFTASAVFQNLNNGTWTPSVASGNSGGTTTTGGAGALVEVLEFTSGFFPFSTYPVGISPLSFTVPESSTTIGTIVSALSGIITYSITGGTHAAFVSINPSTGLISPVGSLDFETQPSLSFNVAATNGSSTDVGTVTVTVTNIIESYEISGPNTVGIDPGGVTSVSGTVLGEGVPVPGATLTGGTSSPGIEIIAAPGGGGTTFLVGTSLDVAFPGLVSLYYGAVQKDIQIVDLVTGTVTANLSAISGVVGQSMSVIATVYSDNGITPHVSQAVSARWANTALAAIAGWAAQTSNGSGQATFTFTPTVEGDSILVVNAGARALAIPVSVSQAASISLYPPAITLLPGGSKGYNAAALDSTGSEIVGVTLGISPVSSAPISGVGGNPGVVTANIGAAPGNYKLRFSTGSVTRDLDVSVRSASSGIPADINSGLANQLVIPRKQTALAVMFDLEELLTTAPRTGANPSVSLSINGGPPVLAQGGTSEIGAGRYVWTPTSDDVNEPGSLIMLITESNSKPVTPIVIGVVTPYGAR